LGQQDLILKSDYSSRRFQGREILQYQDLLREAVVMLEVEATQDLEVVLELVWALKLALPRLPH
jgi:hypothetical protein